MSDSLLISNLSIHTINEDVLNHNFEVRPSLENN